MHNKVQHSIVHGDVIQAYELHVHSSEAPHPPLTSWQDRPELTPELEDLLHVQRDASETLPYRLLGVRQPELTRVYVQQSVRAKESSGERDSGELPSADADRPVPIEEALTADHHLLIIGEPGAGKSTLGQMYVQRLAGEWLDPSGNPPLPEPVLPLRVPAKALAQDAPWSEVLAHAARDRRLNAPVSSEVFARRALGARWLVFVDGLDEIVEPDTRKRVIEALWSRMCRGTDHKLVVTTRPLPLNELQKLRGRHVGLYTIQPFGPVELREFASAWFRAQDPTRAVARAEEFVRQVHDSRLRELVRNPLLATIAAITNTLEPNRELPHNRADLYERFVSHLLEDTASGRNTIAELRRSLTDDPARLARVESLHARRRELVEHLATQRLETEHSLLDIAAVWAGPEYSQEDLAAVLGGTGVLVQTENGLRFLHHSFAEFIAARHLVERIPPGFPQLDELVKQGVRGTKQNSVLFTLALWCRKNGHELNVVFQRLLDGGRDHVLLAGRLLAEDIAVPAELSAQVVDRLLELMIAGRVEFKSSPPPPPSLRIVGVGRVLAELSSSVAKDAIEKLRRLRDNNDLPQGTRVESAIVLGHLDSPLRAAQWLEQFADACDAGALGVLVEGLIELLPDGAEHAAAVAIRRARDADADPAVVLSSVKVLRSPLKRPAVAKELLEQLIERLQDDETALPLRGGPHTDDGGPGWDLLVDLARRLGCGEGTLWSKPRRASSVVDDTVGALLERDGAAAIPELVRIAQSSSGWSSLRNIEFQISVIDVRLASDFLVAVARDQATGDSVFWMACHSLIDTAPDEVVKLATEREEVAAAPLITLAKSLEHKGVNVDSLLQRLLSTKALVGDGTLVWGLLAFGNYIQEVYDAAVAAGPKAWAETAPVLHRAGRADLSAALIDRLIAAPQHQQSLILCLDKMIVNDVPEAAARLFDVVTEQAGKHDFEATARMVGIYQRLGRTDDAIALATAAFDRSLTGRQPESKISTLVNAGGVKSADHVVTAVQKARLRVLPQLAVAAVLARHGFLSQAARIWLDIVRQTGIPADRAIEAAWLLVKSGYRQQAMDAIQAELDGRPLSMTKRANARALLAWLENITPE